MNPLNINDCTTYNDKMCKNYHIEDQLTLEINDIDDLAQAWIISNNGKIFYRLDEDSFPELHETMWLWRAGGKHGHGTINVTQWFHDNWEKLSIVENTVFYLAIAIYDFKYDKLPSAGKWSYDAKLNKNGLIQWQKHDFGFSDTKNENYGLKYLKIIKTTLTKDLQNTYAIRISISETISKKISISITNKIKSTYNYTSIKNLKELKSSIYKTPQKVEHSIKWIDFIPDTVIASIILILTYCFSDFKNILYYFIIYNILVLIYFFFRFKLGGMAWALVLRKKHDKELDSFMVILGLLFTASLGAITSFDFDAENLQSSLVYRSMIFILYMSTNIVFLYILSVISTYTINTLKANRHLMIILILAIGIGVFIQEIINFEQNYKEHTTNVKICEE